MWGVNKGNKIMRRRGQTWEKVAGDLAMVSCGQSGVWGILDGQVFYRTGTYGGAVTYGSSFFLETKLIFLLLLVLVLSGRWWMEV